MTDTLVRDDDGRECWYAMTDLRPIDGAGALPDRMHERKRANAKTVAQLRDIRAALVEDIRQRRPWPGAEHGKAILGRAIDAALADLEARA